MSHRRRRARVEVPTRSLEPCECVVLVVSVRVERHGAGSPAGLDSAEHCGSASTPEALDCARHGLPPCGTRGTEEFISPLARGLRSVGLGGGARVESTREPVANGVSGVVAGAARCAGALTRSVLDLCRSIPPSCRAPFRIENMCQALSY